MSSDLTQMACEVAEVEAVLLKQRVLSWPMLDALGQEIRTLDPSLLLTIARGSSDHATLYIAHLAQRLGGLPVASLPPSLASIYHQPLRLQGALALVISQSGVSPDVVSMIDGAKQSGALTVALLNEPNSPVGEKADRVVPLCANPERAVAATKSVIASMVAGARLIAVWQRDQALLEALEDIASLVSTVTPPDEIFDQVARFSSCFVLGRGATLPIALEAALKLKETCAIHAEAFSSAEVLHGPAALITPGFPVIAFVPQDEARESMLETVKRLSDMGAKILAFDSNEAIAGPLAMPLPQHTMLAPLPMLHVFYTLAEAAARRRGRDPDHPPHLKKVTVTV